MSQKKSAVVVVGHGSLHSDSGRAMLQVAALLREQRIAPVIEAGFLNFSQPSLADAVAQCVAQGATMIIVQPYFLIEGYYVRQDLRQAVRALAHTYRDVHFTIADVLGDHFAMFNLVCKRLAAVEPADTLVRQETGILFVAHGSPVAEANTPILRILQRVSERAGYGRAGIGYLDCNQPDIPTAFDQLIATGLTRLTVLPYFLHLGRHVRNDLPTLFQEARRRHPQVAIQVAHHLDYDPLLAQVAAERIMSSMMC
jgi:sirohydrochlorin ferrochelatase